MASAALPIAAGPRLFFESKVEYEPIKTLTVPNFQKCLGALLENQTFEVVSVWALQSCPQIAVVWRVSGSVHFLSHASLHAMHTGGTFTV